MAVMLQRSFFTTLTKLFTQKCSKNNFYNSDMLVKFMSSRVSICDCNNLIKKPSFRYASTVLDDQRVIDPSAVTKKDWVTITYVKANGEKITTKGKEGDSFLDVAVNNSLDLPGFGLCEGTLCCSTCHLIFKKEDFDRIQDPQTEEELDMMELSFECTDTSRLSCQVTLTKDMDGIEVQVPEYVPDAREL